MPTLATGNGSDEHMVHPFVAQALFPLSKFIFHQHVKATKGNLSLIGAYRMRPIVNIRNIYDVMVSTKEKLDAGILMPCVVSPADWREMPENEQWLWLAYNSAQWNIAFYASWLMSNVPALVVKYHEFYADKVQGMRKVVDFLALEEEYTDEQLYDVTNHREHNFNKGIEGRGKNVPKEARKIVEQHIYSWGILSNRLKEDLT